MEAPPAPGAARWRALSSLLDQVMSSASNGLIVLAVARVASVDAFGSATLLFAFAAAAMGVGRGAIGTPIMLAAGQGHAELRREAGFAATAVLVMALCVSCAAMIPSFMLNVPKMGFAFAIAIPLLVVVDVFRYTLISAAKPHIALAWDTFWALGSGLLFVLTLVRPHAVNDVAMVSSWAALAGVSACGMGSYLRLYPRSRGIAEWWRATFGSRIRYGLEAGLSQINVIIITSIATAVIGVSAAASLRGASTILAPLAIMLSALPLVIIPEAVRSGTSGTAVWRKLCRIGVCGSLLVITIGPGLVLMPERWGELLLGPSWDYARGVLPIVSIEYAALVWGSIAMSFLRFQGKSAQLLAATVTFTAMSIVLCSTMAVLTRSAVGVAAGLAVSAVAMATVITLYVRPRPARV